MPRKGEHPSEETRKKLREARKGKTPFAGHTHNEETRQALRRVGQEYQGTEGFDEKVQELYSEGITTRKDMAKKLGLTEAAAGRYMRRLGLPATGHQRRRRI